jgi:hypothetical protein
MLKGAVVLILLKAVRPNTGTRLVCSLGELWASINSGIWCHWATSMSTHQLVQRLDTIVPIHEFDSSYFRTAPGHDSNSSSRENKVETSSSRVCICHNTIGRSSCTVDDSSDERFNLGLTNPSPTAKTQGRMSDSFVT